MSRNLFFFFQNQDILSVGAKIAYLVSLLLSRAASRMSMRLLSEGASALRNRTPCAGKISSMYVVLTEERRQMPSGLPPLRLWRGIDCKKGTPVNLGCFCFSGKCGGESACVGAVLGKRGSGIVIRLTGDARELLPAGAVQPVPCRLSKIRAAVRHTETFRFSLFTDFQPSHSML